MNFQVPGDVAAMLTQSLTSNVTNMVADALTASLTSSLTDSVSKALTEQLSKTGKAQSFMLISNVTSLHEITSFVFLHVGKITVFKLLLS